LTYPDLLRPLKSSKKEIQQRKKCLPYSVPAF
jgi:hypothetical protein